MFLDQEITFAIRITEFLNNKPLLTTSKQVNVKDLFINTDLYLVPDC